MYSPSFFWYLLVPILLYFHIPVYLPVLYSVYSFSIYYSSANVTPLHFVWYGVLYTPSHLSLQLNPPPPFIITYMYSFLFPFTCTPSLSHLPYTPLPSHYLNPYGPPTPTLQYISHFFLSRIPYEYVCIVHMHLEYLYCISKACSPIKQNNCLTVSL